MQQSRDIDGDSSALVAPATWTYEMWRVAFESVRTRVLKLVVATESAIDVATLAGLRAQHADFRFSDRVWDAYVGNAAKLKGVKRIDRKPYATHPTRMALTCQWVLPRSGDRADDAAVIALLHDYLEEGDGMTPGGVEAMRRRFPREPDAVVAAVLLSEPVIPYEELGPAHELGFWRRAAYLRQALDALAAGCPGTFADAALADKLDNMHDLSYIERNPKLSGERRHAKLADRLGYFALVEELLRPHATEALAALVREAVTARTRELGGPPASVAQANERLATALDQATPHMRRLIRAYHDAIGIAGCDANTLILPSSL